MITVNTVTCPDCAGMGSAVKKINRRRTGSISSVVYDLKKNCSMCEGRGKVRLLRGRVIRALTPEEIRSVDRASAASPSSEPRKAETP